MAHEICGDGVRVAHHRATIAMGDGQSTISSPSWPRWASWPIHRRATLDGVMGRRLSVLTSVHTSAALTPRLTSFALSS